MHIESNRMVQKLVEKGVTFLHPDQVFISPEVDPDRISADGVKIYPGCRISGASTLICSGAVVGYEAPATIENCYIGPKVHLKGGFFKDAVFLEGASMGSGSHVREGTILEEQSSGAHTVGLKQTILFPWVTLGSLINFCDIFMSGGTDRKNHSEVGSSYIHFNFTHNQDKATASLLGDVPCGVMLDKRPIFLGGQGGLVGPCRLTFGTVSAAGSVNRNDELNENRLIFGKATARGSIPYAPGQYMNPQRIIRNNAIYIANMVALSQWYQHVRTKFINDSASSLLHQGLKRILDMNIQERIKRLADLFHNLTDAIETGGYAMGMPGRAYRSYSEAWPDMQHIFQNGSSYQGNRNFMEHFLQAITIGIENKGYQYLDVIRQLTPADKSIGTRWLQSIVDKITDDVYELIPSITPQKMNL